MSDPNANTERDDGFHAGLVGLEPSEALARCQHRADSLWHEMQQLQASLAQTPRGDKVGAHVIKQAMLRVQSKMQRLKPVTAACRASVERRESHNLWADGVRSVCGQDKLTEVYAWMKAERKRRAAPPESP